jgi:hypothetical protein
VTHGALRGGAFVPPSLGFITLFIGSLATEAPTTHREERKIARIFLITDPLVISPIVAAMVW